jgi:hypothetical protein
MCALLTHVHKSFRCLPQRPSESLRQPLWGSGSIRANLYGSVLYAMFSRQVLRIRRGARAKRLPKKYGRQRIPIHQWRAAFFAMCSPHVRPPVYCVK